MWMFITLISMAAAGLATMVGSAVLLTQPWATDPSIEIGSVLYKIALYGGSVALLVCGGFKGFMWLFYHRHEGRRVNKRRSA